MTTMSGRSRQATFVIVRRSRLDSMFWVRLLRLELRRECFAVTRQQADVASDADEETAALEPVPRVGFERRQDAGTFAGGADASDGVLDGGAHGGIAVIARVPERRGEIAGPDEQPVDAVDGGDGLDVRDRGRGFDLHDDADLVVGARRVVLHTSESIG